MTQPTTRGSNPGMIALGIPAGAVCGGVVMWLLVWLAYLVGVSSPWAVYRYGLDGAACGALFGAVIGPGCAAVRGKPWKAAVLGLAVTTVIYCGLFVWMWVAGSFRTLADVARGAAIAIPGVAAGGAAIGWGTARIVAAVEGGWPLTALQRRRVALITAGVIAAGLVAWRWDVYRQGTVASDTCERAAKAFAAGDLDTLLSMLPAFMDDPDVNTDEIRQWFSTLRPFLPQGGQLIVEPPVTTKRGLCRCRGRVVGATYKVAPRVPGMEASFTVSVRRTPWGCKVYVLTEPVATYLASLYGDEAGLHWERWLQQHAQGQ